MVVERSQDRFRCSKQRFYRTGFKSSMPVHPARARLFPTHASSGSFYTIEIALF
jgi:hypothetical protein